MINWDYDIPKNWTPKTDAEWEWFLVREINYGNFENLNLTILKKFFPKIKHLLDPGKRDMIIYFLNHGINQ